MTTGNLDKFTLFESTTLLFEAMIEDTRQARQYIYLEVYKFGNDAVGDRFRAMLTTKAREGVKVKLLLDSWGTDHSESWFSEMIAYGAEVRFFRKIVLAFDFFTKNHRRNHRKLLVIDDKITYIGSANLTAYSINWRELQLRINDCLSHQFRRAFLQSFKSHKIYVLNKLTYRKTLHHGDFEIIQDMPSIYRQRVKKKFEQLISGARKEIIIETPYFLPGFKLRKALMAAAKRGVDVKIIMPKHSDVRLVDLLRNKYLGQLHRSKVALLYYMPGNLHAKAALIDDEIFALGSSNFDYRSFRYLYEIMLFGKNREIIEKMRTHFNGSIEACKAFNYNDWIHRPLIDKIISQLLVPFRHLF
jgi:cardiolipin synthase A/B